jgi:hypothetical protein
MASTCSKNVATKVATKSPGKEAVTKGLNMFHGYHYGLENRGNNSTNAVDTVHVFLPQVWRLV